MPALIPEKFKPLVETALKKLGPGAKCEALRDLRGGKSGAIVLLVDIKSDEGAGLGGQFILKLDEQKAVVPPGPSERERHSEATLRNPEFAKGHIPSLIASCEDGVRTALIYEVAGSGLSNLVTADSIDFGPLKHHCRQLASALLDELNTQYEVKQGVSAHASLSTLLGGLLDETRAVDLHQFVAEQTASRPLFLLAGQLMVNPLWFTTAEVIMSDTANACFYGLLHGDLNLTNLLIDRQQQSGERFWLIDFACSHDGPLGFDHAYFELALLRRHFFDVGEERLFRVLTALEATPGTSAAEQIALPDAGLADCIRSLRSAAQ